MCSLPLSSQVPSATLESLRAFSSLLRVPRGLYIPLCLTGVSPQAALTQQPLCPARFPSNTSLSSADQLHGSAIPSM